MPPIASTTRYASAERIGARVRAIREQQGMTTTDLAKKIGCSQQQICAVELGRINTPVETLARLAEGLGVSLGAFFAEDTAPLPPARQSAALRCLKEVRQLHYALTEKYQQLDQLVAS